MAIRDGTDLMGMGPRRGRENGFCNAAKFTGEIEGFACRRRFGRNVINNSVISENDKNLLMKEKAILENRLNLINDKLNNLKDGSK